jgi:hypothetical protein
LRFRFLWHWFLSNERVFKDYKGSIKFIIANGVSDVIDLIDISFSSMKDFLEGSFIVIMSVLVTIAVVSIAYSFLFTDRY